MDTLIRQQILLFRTGDRLMGLPLSQVQEVLPAFTCKEAPGMPELFAGLIMLRGEVLPVIDSGRIAGPGRSVMHAHHQFIIARGQQHSTALLVEEVVELIESSDPELLRPEFLSEDSANVLSIIQHGTETVIVLDLNACLRKAGSLPVFPQIVPASIEDIS